MTLVRFKQRVDVRRAAERSAGATIPSAPWPNKSSDLKALRSSESRGIATSWITKSNFNRYLVAVGVIGLICAAASATSAQQLSTIPSSGITEADTAFRYTHLAYDADDIVIARSNLQKAINCVVGPDDKSFRAAAGNPCAGQGMGAIRDIHRAFLVWLLRRAVGEASHGLKRVELPTVRMDALSAMDYLQSVRQAWLAPALSARVGRADKHSHAVIKLRRDEIELSELRGAPATNSKGSIIGTLADMLIDRGRHVVRYVALRPKDGNSALAIRWSALKFVSTGPNAHPTFRITTDVLAVAPQFVSEVEAQPSYIDVEGNLVGRPVVTADGQTVGKLVGLVVERESGIVDYVLLSPNSIIGVTRSPLALPWKAIANLMVEHDVVLTLDEQQLARAPIFRPK